MKTPKSSGACDVCKVFVYSIILHLVFELTIISFFLLFCLQYRIIFLFSLIYKHQICCMNNNTVFNLEQDDIPHYEKNQPKLQWLIILIPVMVAFVFYTFLRIRNKRRKARQRLVDEEALTIPSVVMADVIPAPAPIFHHNGSSCTINDSRTRIYDIGLRTYPLLRFSNNSYSNNTTMPFWQRFYSSTSQPNSADKNNNAHQNRRRQRRRRRRLRRGELNRTPSPPPVYSISSPPKYEEVVALERESEFQSQTCTTTAQ